MATEVISYSDAKARGLKKYFTGIPCRNGHIAERYVSCGCEVCARDKCREAARRRLRCNPNWRARSDTPRNRAKLSGEKFYFTGKECKNGHLCARSVKFGYCIECIKIFALRSLPKRKEAIKRWNERNADKLKAKRAAWNKLNKGYKKEQLSEELPRKP